MVFHVSLRDKVVELELFKEFARCSMKIWFFNQVDSGSF